MFRYFIRSSSLYSPSFQRLSSSLFSSSSSPYTQSFFDDNKRLVKDHFDIPAFENTIPMFPQNPISSYEVEKEYTKIINRIRKCDPEISDPHLRKVLKNYYKHNTLSIEDVNDSDSENNIIDYITYR